MATNKIKLGDIEIPIKENVDLVSFQRENYAYLPDGASINNESSLKLKYDPISNTVDIGSIKSVTYDGNGNPIGEPSTFSGKIKLWSTGDPNYSGGGSGSSANLDAHIKDNTVHMDIEDRRSLTTINGLFEVMSIGYSDEEEIVYGPIENGSEEYSYRIYYIEPLQTMDFNTFKIKMPKTAQDSVEKVYVKAFLITGEDSYAESGRTLGYSTNGIRIYSTNTSEGYFEWNFANTIRVNRKEELVLKFFTINDEGKEVDFLIKSRIKYLEGYDDPTCYLKSSGSERLLYAAPECVFAKKTPNSLFFK